MPKNFKEELFFSLIMAGLMVFVMAGYNVALSDGFSAGYLLEVLKGYPVALVIALILDLGVVGPLAKKLFFTRIFKPEMEQKSLIIGIWISILMVAGMVSLMSAFGIIVTANFGGNLVLTYLHTWIFNLFMALPLQLLIVGPIARKALAAFQNRGSETATDLD
ncbi:DUF2798 domain-containing protein [Lacticaseibacillus baoqingensis]|uniref:DUF2798 domain-containing protein n=1 Tax=Lacticaseibacillus baoqingensis TaxID=2486013 RepID=A0ABW4E8G1_9LACO|nr:DUF2798 domain-containing protein [Lacticaseibacillus baoqingensis]